MRNFIENNWCSIGHIGFVLNVEMKIDFNSTLKKIHERRWIMDKTRK